MTRKYLFFVLPLLLVGAFAPAFAATVIPQVEKLDVMEDFIVQVEPQLINNNHVEKDADRGLQQDWILMVYQSIASVAGLELPHPSDPGNRDVSTYISAGTGSCVDEIAEGNTEDVSRHCSHAIAKQRIGDFAFNMKDMFTVHMFGENNGNVYHYAESNDVFHERVVSAYDMEFVIDRMWGANFDFDAPENHGHKLMKEGFEWQRNHDLCNNLPEAYKQKMIDHHDNNTFVDFYTGEVRVTHDDAGIWNCD